MSNNVLQGWMGKLPWKQQSVVLSSLRGPDTSHSPQIKKVGKWIRGITQNNADVSSEYMQSKNLPLLKDLEKELEFCSVHYVCHFLGGLEVIGYKHPHKKTSQIARNYYSGLVVDVLHLNPETKNQMEKRLEDKK